jgi:hypothetical protein
MHERVRAAGQESVIDEEVLFDGERVIMALQVAGTIARDAVPQRQILGTCRRADRIGLDETEPLDGGRKRHGLKQTSGDGVPPQGRNRRRGQNYSS